MTVDILRSIPLIEQAAPFLYSLAIPIFSITLQQAAKLKASILANNLKKGELGLLKMDVNDALAEELRAIRGDIPYTPDIALRASIAKEVQTKIESASEKRDEGKPGKPKKRTYMGG